MKVTLLSGNDATALWKRKKQIIKTILARGWETHTLTSSVNLAEQFRSTSLFESNKLFILEDLKILNDKNLKWLKDNQDFEANLLIVCEGPLPAKIKNIFDGKVNIEVFDLPKKIYLFLESLFPGNTKNSVHLLHQVLATEPIELTFHLIAVHLRDLYWVKKDPLKLNAPSWKLEKLKRQSQKYTDQQLSSFIRRLAKIDLEAKTSQGSLSQSLDLALILSLK